MPEVNYYDMHQWFYNITMYKKKKIRNYTDARKRWMTKKIQATKCIKYYIATNSHLQILSIHKNTQWNNENGERDTQSRIRYNHDNI